MTKIFTDAALARYSLPELKVLFRNAHEEFDGSPLGSVERRIAAANMQNLARAMATREKHAPRP